MSTADGDVTIASAHIDDPAGDEVLVDIAVAGICHTDLDVAASEPNILLGHEGAGTVRAIGPEVTDLRIGERVLCNWAIPCAHCAQCIAGRQHLCSSGPLAAATGAIERHARISATTVAGRPRMRSFSLGTLASSTLVRRAALVQIDESLPFDAAAIIGCAVMTGVGSVTNAAAVEAGSTVAVIGAGAVGINVIQGARLARASRVIAFDVSAGRLARARAFGATDTELVSEQPSVADLRAAVMRFLDGGFADYAFEATGMAGLATAPLALVRDGGKAVQVSGFEQSLTIDMSMFEWDKTYINPLYGGCQPGRDFPHLAELHASGKLLVSEQIDARYELDEISRAFHDYRTRKVMKAVVSMPDGRP